MNKKKPESIGQVVKKHTEKVGGRPEWKKYAIAAVIILLIEIFLWNHSFWLSMGHEPIDVEEVYTQTGELFALNEDFYLESGSFLEIRDINQDIKNIYINIETDKEEKMDTLKVRFNLIDEGKKNYYSVASRVISSRLQKLNYISLYPYGNLKSLKIDFPDEEDTTILVTDLVFNPRVPMFFSIERVIVMYLIYLVGMALFFRPYQTYYEPGSKKQRRITAGLCAVLLLFFIFLSMKGNDDYGKYTMDKYNDLTHALAQGMVSLDMEVDERLLSVENPYDISEKSEWGINGYMWDYAYFEGKFYVYFGVVPVILTYLPYYMLTGQDISHTVVYFIFLLPLIVGAFFLMDILIKTYCKKLPLKLYYLFLVTFMMGIGMFIFAKRIDIYHLPIMSAVCFTVWGLYLWLSSRKETGEYTVWKVLLGSVCMALVAGCRPQLLMGSFLAFPIFADRLKQISADFKKKKKKRKKEHVLFLTAFCIPFLVIGSLIMWYNYARFGSPFDFGAAYNLTTNDMGRRGIHIARFLSGLFALWFKFPYCDVEFPYLGATEISTFYQGLTIQEPTIGGIFVTNFILWPCFLIYYFRKNLRENQAFLFAVISAVSGVIITCADVQMAGVVTRYMADFSIFFYLASFMVIFAFIDGYYKKQSGASVVFSEAAWCRGLAVLCCITIIYWFLSIFMLYEDKDYVYHQQVWYYHLKAVFGVLEI